MNSLAIEDGEAVHFFVSEQNGKMLFLPPNFKLAKYFFAARMKKNDNVLNYCFTNV